MTERPGKLKADYEKILGRVFLVLVSVILTFLAADFISRYLLEHRRSPMERRFPVGVSRKPKPYVMFGGTENGTLPSGVNLNSLGYRGKAPSESKEPGEYRVFMLGGSTVVNGNPTIPELLEQEFRQNGFHSVNVYNFGVVASVSSMELSRILSEISDFQPDLIVMYNGYNDIFIPYYFDPRPGYPFNFVAYESNPLLESDIRSYPTISLFLYGSNILRYAFPEYFVKGFVDLEQVRDAVGYKSAGWKNEIAGVYARNLSKANALSNTFDAEFVAFFQPVLYSIDPLTDKQISNLNPKRRRYEPAKKEYYETMKKMILAEVETAQQVSAIRFVDLSDIYDGESGWYFIDECHTRQESKPIVAKEMYGYLANIFSIE